MNTSFTHTDLSWPCTLSDSLKDALLDVSDFREGIESVGLRLANPKLEGIVYVIDGLASVSMVVEDSHMLVGGIIGRCDWLGAGQLISSVVPDLVCEELEPIKTLFFPKQKVIEIAEQNYEAYKWLYYCSREMQSRWIQTNLSALHNKESRVVFALVMMFVKKNVRAGVVPDVHITHQQLSNLTYVSRPRVSEVLKELEQEGVIEQNRHHIYLLSRERLFDRLNKLNLSVYDPRISNALTSA